jgi:hypothetical protein
LGAAAALGALGVAEAAVRLDAALREPLDPDPERLAALVGAIDLALGPLAAAMAMPYETTIPPVMSALL